MREPSRFPLTLLLIFVAAFPSLGSPTVMFTPAQWKFGSIVKGDKIQTVITAKNAENADITIGLLPTCTCMSSIPAERLIKAGGEGTFVITYDSSDDTGITRKDFVVQTKPPGLAPQYYSITGIVRAERQAAAAQAEPHHRSLVLSQPAGPLSWWLTTTLLVVEAVRGSRG